ncbi:MAG: thiamine pyrophosphate-binding protein, partial [Pseudomonadota bacterium]
APKNIPWADVTRHAREDYKKWSAPTQNPGAVQVADLVLQMAECVPEDAIICNAAGNYASWIHRFYPFRHFKTQLAPTSGSMGYS